MKLSRRRLPWYTRWEKISIYKEPNFFLSSLPINFEQITFRIFWIRFLLFFEIRNNDHRVYFSESLGSLEISQRFMASIPMAHQLNPGFERIRIARFVAHYCQRRSCAAAMKITCNPSDIFMAVLTG